MNKPAIKLDPEKVRNLIELNFDSRQYFFSTTDERLLGWLWENGILDKIKQKPSGPARQTYRMPELDYLNRAADKSPSTVVDIMLQVSSSPNAFTPEVIDRFLQICSKLPADQLKRMTLKMHEENWVKLMAIFNDPGFEYEKMLKILADAKDYDNILLLAEVILSVRTKEDVAKSKRAWTDDPFYMNNLEYTKVFEHLLAVDDAHLEKALAISAHALGETTLLGNTNGEDRAFKIDETYHLFDVDFFTLEPGLGEHYSPRDEVRELAAVAKTTLQKIIGNKCDDQNLVRRIYDQYIKPLPDSRTIWRFQLYMFSLCPETFKAEIREQIFRVIGHETPGDIISGAEYERFLQATFGVLEDADKRTYVAKIIDWFTKKEWQPSGRDLMSCIAQFLTPDEKQLAEKSFGQLQANYAPEPSIGRMISGTVVPQPPPGTEEEWEKSVPEIVNHLKTDWSPNALKEKYKRNEDFLRPIDADGIADRLKSEIKSRPTEFIDNAKLFFDRENIDPHYTYALLQTIDNVARERKIPEGVNIASVFALMKNIIDSATAHPFETEEPTDRKEKGWLAYWEVVHDGMADVMKELLAGGEKPLVDFIANRDAFFGVIEYLLGHNDPELKDEELETAKIKTTSGGSSNYMVSDPFTIAINSVRGRAFQALVNFSYRDAQLMPKDQPIKIAPEVKKLYEEVLSREGTRAIMFMFGHYLPSFYFRDKAWVRGLLPQIFPTTPEEHHLYLAAWEGYLANSIYEEMFFDPEIQKLYERGTALKEEGDSQRKHFKEPDESLATHLALAFMYYAGFDFDHSLFKMFWSGDSKRHGEFVSFLGRMFVSGDNASANDLLNKETRAKERLKAFWDWTLKEFIDPALFMEFGFWINLKKDVFDPIWLADHAKKTLEKTGGALDWDFGLAESLIQLSQVAPEDTLAILRLHLLEATVRNKKQRLPFHMDKEWHDAFKILYGNLTTKKATYSLIDDLVREGGIPFWGLKDILKT